MEKYEQLMRWAIKNIDRKLYNLHDLGYSIQEIDIHHVINNKAEFVEFVKDLEKRTGTNITDNKVASDNTRQMNMIKSFFDNHYINLSDWELNFMRSIKGLKKVSEKQFAVATKIISKIDKRYLS